MENPYQKFDEEQDKRYEKLIRQKIQNIIELAGNESDDTIRISLLQKIVDLYEDLRIQVLNYTNYDEKEKQEYLKEIDELLDKKYKALQKRKEENKKSEDSKKDRQVEKEENQEGNQEEKSSTVGSKQDTQKEEKQDLYTRLYEKALMEDEFKSWDEYRISEMESEEGR